MFYVLVLYWDGENILALENIKLGLVEFNYAISLGWIVSGLEVMLNMIILSCRWAN